MKTHILPLFMAFLLLGCSKDGNEPGPEPIEPQNMSLLIELEGNFRSYDTQVTVFSWGNQKVAVNGGQFQNGIGGYRLSTYPSHHFEFEDKLQSFGFRIALGTLEAQSVSFEPAEVTVSAYVNGVVFDVQNFETNAESKRDSIGFVYNAQGQQFIEFDSRN